MSFMFLYVNEVSEIENKIYDTKFFIKGKH